MVLMQPFVRFAEPVAEPFKWDARRIEEQVNRITRTLEIASESDRSAHFTLFPEYSVPGLVGVRAIEQYVSSEKWHCNSVLIAGVDGLTQEEFVDLQDVLSASLQNGDDLSAAQHDSWVNCSVTLVKEQSGTLRTWLQPKIAAASPEEFAPNSAMHRGGTVTLFECQFDNQTPCHFLSLLCFDWVGKVGGECVRTDLLAALQEQWTGNRKALHWVFVLQHNKAPNHYTFMEATKGFLSDATNHASVDRTDAAVVMVCTASGPSPSAQDPFGFSSFVFAPRAPVSSRNPHPPTYTYKARIKHSDRQLEPCKDLAMRETGECIHVCEVRVPCFITPDPSDREMPIIAHVYSVDGESADPRLCGGPVPAATKWVNDELDGQPSIAEKHFAGRSTQDAVGSAESMIVQGYRTLSGQHVSDRLRMSTTAKQDIDEWTEIEKHALRHITGSLALVGAGVSLTVENCSLHAALDVDDKVVEIVAMRGESHEACRKHFEAIASMTHSGVLVLTRDEDNTRLTPKEVTKFYEDTDRSGISFVDFQTVFEAARGAADTDDLTREMSKITNVSEPHIL